MRFRVAACVVLLAVGGCSSGDNLTVAPAVEDGGEDAFDDTGSQNGDVGIEPDTGADSLALDSGVEPDADDDTGAPEQDSASDSFVEDSSSDATGDSQADGDDSQSDANDASDGNANDGNPNDGNPGDGNPNDGNLNDGNANDGNPNDGNVNDGGFDAISCDAPVNCYVDKDKDTYPVPGPVTLGCGTCPSGTTKLDPAVLIDCNDSNPSVHPFETDYFTTAYCVDLPDCTKTSFDYDCNTHDDPAQPKVFSCTGYLAGCVGDGWTGVTAAPACGKPGSYGTCSSGVLACTTTSSPGVQACK